MVKGYFFGIEPKPHEKTVLDYLFRDSSYYGTWSDANGSNDKKEGENLSESFDDYEDFCRNGGDYDDE